MTAEQKLLPCPFCGCEAKHEHRAPGGTMSSGMEPHIQRIACTKCGTSQPWEHPKSEWGKQNVHDASLRESLTERWNTRPAPTEAEVEVEYEFQVMQDDCLQASGYAPSPEEAAKEADHYAMLYGQDGPVEVVFYKRIRMARVALGVEGGDDGRG